MRVLTLAASRADKLRSNDLLVLEPAKSRTPAANTLAETMTKNAIKMVMTRTC